MVVTVCGCNLFCLELAVDTKVNTVCNSWMSFWFMFLCIALRAQRGVNADLTGQWRISLMPCSVELCQKCILGK